MLKLSQTLDALVKQNELIDELIVVADNKNYSEEATLMLEEYSQKFKMKIIPQYISGRGRSRNTGAEAASGDLLIFLDDDMLAEKDLIKNHIKYHNTYPDIIVSGNGYRNPRDANYDFGKFLINMESKWISDDEGMHDMTFKNFNFTAQNMSLPNKIFQQLNGFDIRFSDGEDFDFGIRAINSSIRVIYDIKLLAWHNDWPKIDRFINRQNEYTEAKREMIKIHPDYIRLFPHLKITQGSPVKKIIAFIIRKTVAQWIISRGFLKYTPLKIKYFFYQLVIFSNSSTNR